jgi:hypothetical protein
MAPEQALLVAQTPEQHTAQQIKEAFDALIVYCCTLEAQVQLACDVCPGFADCLEEGIEVDLTALGQKG